MTTPVDENGIPIVPDSLQIYNSYTQDPPYALLFTYIWVGTASACALLALPRLLRSLRSGRLVAGLRGIGWDYTASPGYEPVPEQEKVPVASKTAGPDRRGNRLRGWITALATWSLYSPPGLRLDVGQSEIVIPRRRAAEYSQIGLLASAVILILGYLVTLLICITKDAQLVTNANRAGFLTVAQLPLIFLLSTKNNVLAILMGRGYEKLNFLHRWSGRAIFLSATIHGSLWINNHRKLGVSLLSEKELRGLFAYGTLCLMVIMSLKPVRSALYQFFFISHIVGFVTFFILVCHHTPYAQPWIFPAIAFYGLDMILRLLRFRFRTASVTANDKQMTTIAVDNCDSGWVAGQHVRLRILSGGRVFESHPLTICNAPASVSNIEASRGQILLASRVVGDWSRALNSIGLASNKKSENCCESVTEGAEVTVMLDGPYGGISFDPGRYEHVLLVAGGAGVTFTLGILDDLVGRIVRGRKGGEITTKIEFAWCIKSFGCIRWFESQLRDIANAASRDPSVSLHLKFFVTCLCDPEAVPKIANSEVTIEKPSISKLLRQFVSEASHGTGGIGVATSGPESLVSEARNSVAMLGAKGASIGGIALHTEVFCL